MPEPKYRRLKIMCYVSGNIGTVIWGGLLAVQSGSLLKAALIFVIPIISMNLLLFYLFRMRERADGNTSV